MLDKINSNNAMAAVVGEKETAKKTEATSKEAEAVQSASGGADFLVELQGAEKKVDKKTKGDSQQSVNPEMLMGMPIQPIEQPKIAVVTQNPAQLLPNVKAQSSKEDVSGMKTAPQDAGPESPQVEIPSKFKMTNGSDLGPEILSQLKQIPQKMGNSQSAPAPNFQGTPHALAASGNMNPPSVNLQQPSVTRSVENSTGNESVNPNATLMAPGTGMESMGLVDSSVVVPHAKPQGMNGVGGNAYLQLLQTAGKNSAQAKPAATLETGSQALQPADAASREWGGFKTLEKDSELSDLGGAFSPRGLEVLPGAPQPQVQSTRGAQVVPPMDVRGNVVKGAMARDRLSSEAVLSLGKGIHSLGAQGGGEIRLRLFPENLGELRVHVSTLGNQVSLKIQASDEGARKVLEESMNSLKDGLSSQNLSLGRVELATLNPTPHSSNMMNGMSQNNPDSFSGFNSQNGGGNRSGGMSDYEAQQEARVASVRGTSGLSSMPGAAQQLNARASGRLNVLA